MSPVPIYTPGERETKWSKVPCLRKQRDGRGLNPQPPDSEFAVLRWLNTVLAVREYMSFANFGKRKVTARNLASEKYTDERF